MKVYIIPGDINILNFYIKKEASCECLKKELSRLNFSTSVLKLKKLNKS